MLDLARQCHVGSRPERNVLILFDKQVAYDPSKYHTTIVVQMRGIVRGVIEIVLPARFGSDRVAVVLARLVEADPAGLQRLRNSNSRIPLIRQILDDASR